MSLHLEGFSIHEEVEGVSCVLAEGQLLLKHCRVVQLCESSGDQPPKHFSDNGGGILA